MSFADQPFEARIDQMGDEAEGVFEQYYPKNWVRYGLNRPPIHMPSVPAFVRYTPDYLASKTLVEVQGFGRDQKIKLKHDKFCALAQWDKHHPVDIFLWDSKNRRWGVTPVRTLWKAMQTLGGEDSFDGGKNPYRWVMAADLVMDWNYVTAT